MRCAALHGWPGRERLQGLWGQAGVDALRAVGGERKRTVPRLALPATVLPVVDPHNHKMQGQLLPRMASRIA